jgi:hypothetical protein
MTIDNEKIDINENMRSMMYYTYSSTYSSIELSAVASNDIYRVATMCVCVSVNIYECQDVFVCSIND